MRRSERYAMYATHALLRCVLATFLTVGELALTSIARDNKSGPAVMVGMLLTLACLLWAILEATESVRLRRISNSEREHETQRAIRPKTENQPNQ